MLKSLRKSVIKFFGLYVLPIAIDIYLSTIRIKCNKKTDQRKKAVYVFWHGKMFAGWRLFKGLNPCAIVSESSDGEILTRILKRWGYEVFRGSSSKHGKEALQNMKEFLIHNPVSIGAVLTPDGPRGPARKFKNGALIVSNECTIPVVTVKIEYTKYCTLKSWDGFEIPYPFTKCKVEMGEDIFYEEYLDDENLIEFKKNLSERM